MQILLPWQCLKLSSISYCWSYVCHSCLLNTILSCFFVRILVFGQFHLLCDALMVVFSGVFIPISHRILERNILVLSKCLATFSASLLPWWPEEFNVYISLPIYVKNEWGRWWGMGEMGINRVGCGWEKGRVDRARHQGLSRTGDKNRDYCMNLIIWPK